MGFVVGSTYIIGLLVVITAFEVRLAQIAVEANEIFMKRSINNEK